MVFLVRTMFLRCISQKRYILPIYFSACSLKIFCTQKCSCV